MIREEKMGKMLIYLLSVFLVLSKKIILYHQIKRVNLHELNSVGSKNIAYYM